MSRKFAIQSYELFGRRPDICKNLRGVGKILFNFGMIERYDNQLHHCYLPQVNEASPYRYPVNASIDDINSGKVKASDIFITEGKEILHVCMNCGLVYEDLLGK